MLDLVLRFWLVALTPWAVGLALKLISGVAGLISPAARPTDRSPFPGGQFSRSPYATGRGATKRRQFSCDPMIN